MMDPTAAPPARRRTVSFSIPVFRNEGALAPTHEQIRGVFAGPLAAYDYEVVFVDDGSDDGSLAELLAIRERDPHVKVIAFTRNFGQMAAMLAGLAAARGDAVVNISADLQDPVDLIPQMVREWEERSEIVICHRAQRDDALGARLTSWLFYGIVRLAVPQVPRGGFDFILMDRKVVDAFNRIDVRNRFFQGDILWFGFRTKFIPYRRLERKIGRSQYTLAKKLKNSLDALLDSSYMPIRFISLFGFAVAFSGFAYALTVVYAKLVDKTPFTGWAPLMIVTLVTSGSLMLMLGIVGEYVWRIYDEVRKKPNYVVREEYR
jgi:dolichol-phosphate mannosyltransferase